jgi:diguanylate cyclase (GGDEF)-like protein
VLAINFGTVAIVLMLRSALLMLPEGILFAAPMAEALSQDWLVAYVIIAPVVGTLNLALIDRARLTSRYRDLANSDVLTGVASRGHFLERAEARFRQAHSELRALAVLLIDIDHFKAINDGHGHQVGDLVLQQVSATIAGALREVDLLGRIGGEEFAVLLPDAALEDALIVAERVRRSVARSTCVQERDELRVTVSIGCAVRKPGDTRFEAVLRRADLAMYAAKHAGRDRVSQFQPGLHAVAGGTAQSELVRKTDDSSTGR